MRCDRLALDIAAVEAHAAGVGREQSRHQIEQGGLAGAVGADQRMDFAGFDRQARVRHGADAAELLGDIPDLDDGPLPRWRAQKVWQRQTLVDLALAHGRLFLGRRAQAAADAWTRCRRGRWARTARSPRTRCRTRAASCRSRSTTARGRGCRTERRAPDPGCGACRRSRPSPAARPRTPPRWPRPRRGRSGNRAARRPRPVTTAESTNTASL